ncbi:spore coat protein GerQ [Scopulibacillus darangshiensis]
MPYAPQGQQVMPQMFTGAGGAPQGGQMPQGYMPQMGAHGGSAPPPSAFQGVQGAPYLNPLTEQSYIENILRLNLEKVATVYATFEGNTEWNAKVFRGEVEAAGRDHVIINDTSTGTRYLIPMVYVDYITFQGPINYAYPFQ